VKVHADVFPARAALAPEGFTGSLELFLPTGGDAPEGTRRVDKARVVVVDETILIAIDSPEGPKLVFQEKILSYNKEGKLHRVLTVGDKNIVFRKDENCGCGSRLRSWYPYGSVIMADDDNN
jgi:hypothetical protein